MTEKYDELTKQYNILKGPKIGISRTTAQILEERKNNKLNETDELKIKYEKLKNRFEKG